MRIGIIAHPKHPIAEPFAGGLENHTHLLASGLRRKRHDVTVFASNRSDQDLGLEPICGQTAVPEVGLAEAPDVALFREHDGRAAPPARRGEALDARRIASPHDPHGGEKAARFLLERADA
ncbi:hypothetical protein [Hansschlegelia sp. KR7-227]|uniref:hypothetical protein n=1 Tax=Hansschlegelia sp. KR7-227 TaxID=3400914 RepID=UPI003BFCD109